MKGSYLGPLFEQHDIEQRLKAAGAVFSVVNEDDMIAETAQALADGKVVGWHQGRMEFGPRALGGRSIIADPRSPSMQKQFVRRNHSCLPKSWKQFALGLHIQW